VKLFPEPIGSPTKLGLQFFLKTRQFSQANNSGIVYLDALVASLIGPQGTRQDKGITAVRRLIEAQSIPAKYSNVSFI
jgi:hypothetical protein